MSNNEETTISVEEADHLVRSTKKHKATSQSFMPQRPILSYKDSVLRPSFDWEDHAAHSLPSDEDDPCSDIKLDSDDTTILLSKEEKLRTRAPWRSALIVKAFGKSLGFKYFDHKIRTIWKPTEDIHIIDLGLDYFLIRFKLKEEYWKVIGEGPWVIGHQFLSIRRWSPGFRPLDAQGWLNEFRA